MVKQVKLLEYEEDGYTRVEEKKERAEYKPVVEERSKTPGSKSWYDKTGNQKCLYYLIISVVGLFLLASVVGLFLLAVIIIYYAYSKYTKGKKTKLRLPKDEAARYKKLKELEEKR